jgi:2-polyprenyl-6-methoxyphenol hydroxylase-like FAD-dependent oxidoreductase
MAIEDAYCLAEELGRAVLQNAPSDEARVSPESISAAFTAFRVRRYAKTKAMVEMGRRILALETGVPHPLLARLRDSAMGLAYSRGWLLAALEKQVISDLVVPLETLR